MAPKRSTNSDGCTALARSTGATAALLTPPIAFWPRRSEVLAIGCKLQRMTSQALSHVRSLGPVIESSGPEELGPSGLRVTDVFRTALSGCSAAKRSAGASFYSQVCPRSRNSCSPKRINEMLRELCKVVNYSSLADKVTISASATEANNSDRLKSLDNVSLSCVLKYWL